MLRKSHCRLGSSPKAENTKDSLRGPPWPQRKDSGTPPAFDIGPATAEEQTKADCHTHKGSEQRSTALQRSPLPFTRKGNEGSRLSRRV